ncbi:MAG: DNA topoisomerase [Moraxella sp.]
MAGSGRKPTQSKKPAAPFATSTLQQAASTALAFRSKTMMLAQRLYEAGHITHMRTDSTFLSADALTSVRGFIERANTGANMSQNRPMCMATSKTLKKRTKRFGPSDVLVQHPSAKDMERDAQRLYELIWRQFVACQMPPAQYQSMTLIVNAGEIELRAKGRVMTLDGYTKVQPPAKNEDNLLPDVKIGKNWWSIVSSLPNILPSRQPAILKQA